MVALIPAFQEKCPLTRPYIFLIGNSAPAVIENTSGVSRTILIKQPTFNIDWVVDRLKICRLITAAARVAVSNKWRQVERRTLALDASSYRRLDIRSL